MASYYVTLSTARSTSPDPVALSTAAKTATSDPSAVLTRLADGTFRGKKAAPWSGVDISAVQAVLDTTPEFTPQLRAQRDIDALSLLEKAIIVTILDQFNLVRARLVPPLTAVTVDQMIAAVRAKAGTL